MTPSHHRHSSSSPIYQPYTNSSPFPQLSAASTSTSAHSYLSPPANVHIPLPGTTSLSNSLDRRRDQSVTGIPSSRVPSNSYAPYATHSAYELQPPPLSRPDPYRARKASAHQPITTSTLSPYTPVFLHPSHPLSGASSVASIAERTLRSPHPPLTASLHPSHNLWPPPLQPIEPIDSPGRSFHFTTLTDIPSVPIPNSVRSSPYGPQTQIPLHPSAPPFLPAPSSLHRGSPLHIPPPLRFNYSASPPKNYEMPPRKKAALAGGSSGQATPSTPQTVSSSGSRRKPIAKGNGWTMEQTYDSVGQKKEVIVIDDSESPRRLPKKRTRAAVAAEAALVNGHGTNGSSSAAGSAKKRKADEVSDAGSVKKAKAKASGVSDTGLAQR